MDRRSPRIDAKETRLPAANKSMFDRHASVHMKRRLALVSTVLAPPQGNAKCFRRIKIPSPCPDKIHNCTSSRYVHVHVIPVSVCVCNMPIRRLILNVLCATDVSSDRGHALRSVEVNSILLPLEQAVRERY